MSESPLEDASAGASDYIIKLVREILLNSATHRIDEVSKEYDTNGKLERIIIEMIK